MRRQHEERRQDPQQVRRPVRDRVDADQRPHEHAADQYEQGVLQLVQAVVCQRRLVPTGEVQDERRGHKERPAHRRKRQHLGSARVQRTHEPTTGASVECPQGQCHGCTERQEDRRDHLKEHVLHHVHVEDRVVVDAEARHRGNHDRAEPEDNERDCAADRPVVPQARQSHDDPEVASRDGAQSDREPGVELPGCEPGVRRQRRR